MKRRSEHAIAEVLLVFFGGDTSVERLVIFAREEGGEIEGKERPKRPAGLLLTTIELLKVFVHFGLLHTWFALPGSASRSGFGGWIRCRHRHTPF